MKGAQQRRTSRERRKGAEERLQKREDGDVREIFNGMERETCRWRKTGLNMRHGCEVRQGKGRVREGKANRSSTENRTQETVRLLWVHLFPLYT